MSALSVADEILKAAKRLNRSLTPMQLMKLTYIAHGFGLAKLGEDLFSDRIEAWRYGPVIPSLYQATKTFGRDPIPFNLIEEARPSTLSDQAQKLVNQVVEKYSHLSGPALSDLTHQIGTPWHQVYKTGVLGIEIPDSLIKQHYQELLVNG